MRYRVARTSHATLAGSTRFFRANSLAEPMRAYIPKSSAGKIVLWCYLIWYLVVVYLYFDPSPAIWLNAIGISAVIGTALVLSVGGSNKVQRWQAARLFAIPFCVSSFSSLIKDKGFVLIFPPDMAQLADLVAACAVFVLFALALKQRKN